MTNPNSSAQRSFAAEPYDSVAAVLSSKQITAALAGQRVFTKDGYCFEVVDSVGTEITAGGAHLVEITRPYAPSRAEVATITIPPDVQAILTSGYHSPGDGGGATYKRVAAQPSHAGKVRSGDGAWWELVNDGSVSVKQFGAKGDGVSDDTVALQKAAQYIATFGGPLLFPGAGPYLILADIEFVSQTDGPSPLPDSDFVLSDVTPVSLIGSGRTVVQATAEMDSMFKLWWNDDEHTHQAPWYSEIKGFYFDGNGLADKCIAADHAFGCKVHENRFGGADYAVYAGGYGGWLFQHNQVATKWGLFATDRLGDSVITGNDFYPRDGGAGVRLTYYGGDTKISENVFTGTGNIDDVLTGVQVDGDSTEGNTTGNLVISSNEFNGMAGLKVYQGGTSENIYNIIVANNHTSQYGDVNPCTLVDAVAVTNIIVVNNHFNANGIYGDAQQRGVVLTNCDGYLISGNVFDSFDVTCVAVYDSIGGSVSDNHFTDYSKADVGGEAVFISGSSYRNTVRDNKFRQTQTSYGQVGVKEDTGADFNKAVHNEFIGVATPYVKAGSATLFMFEDYGFNAPTTGTYLRGARVLNAEPSASGVSGWVCTTGGTPGTWKSFGDISS